MEKVKTGNDHFADPDRYPGLVLWASRATNPKKTAQNNPRSCQKGSTKVWARLWIQVPVFKA